MLKDSGLAMLVMASCILWLISLTLSLVTFPNRPLLSLVWDVSEGVSVVVISRSWHWNHYPVVEKENEKEWRSAVNEARLPIFRSTCRGVDNDIERLEKSFLWVLCCGFHNVRSTPGDDGPCGEKWLWMWFLALDIVPKFLKFLCPQLIFLSLKQTT